MQPNMLTRLDLPTGLENKPLDVIVDYLEVFGNRACDERFAMRGAIMLEAAKRLKALSDAG